MTQKTKDEIANSIRDFRLPRYEEIPDVGLYLEQTAKYINGFLEPLPESALTASMISNYVKKGMVKNPVKKQYDREHIASLLVIAVSKTVLSLEETVQLLHTCPEGQEGYDLFCTAFSRVMETVFSHGAIPNMGQTLLEDTLTAVACKLYLEKQFREMTSC